MLNYVKNKLGGKYALNNEIQCGFDFSDYQDYTIEFTEEDNFIVHYIKNGLETTINLTYEVYYDSIFTGVQYKVNQENEKISLPLGITDDLRIGDNYVYFYRAEPFINVESKEVISQCGISYFDKIK